MRIINSLLAWIFFGCYHKYGRWGEWGLTYQARYCEKCGKCQTRSI